MIKNGIFLKNQLEQTIWLLKICQAVDHVQSQVYSQEKRISKLDRKLISIWISNVSYISDVGYKILIFGSNI